jgi:hypothetical protein
MDPIRDLTGAARGGTMSAIGLPSRVTLIGIPVFCTSASTASQVALNLEMVISSISNIITMVDDYGQFDRSSCA